MKTKQAKTMEQILFEMLTERTGIALCDSGSIYGRNWEWNQRKTVNDFMNEPEVTYEVDSEGNLECYTISVFHYLKRQLAIDQICQKFNEKNIGADNWNDVRFHGVSKEAGEFLDVCNGKLQIHRSFNSYNGEDFLSQVIQGVHLTIERTCYVLLQIHGGCDVRSGYTDARLFVLDSEYAYDGGFMYPQEVFGTFTPNDADLETPALPGMEIVSEIIHFDNCYNGYDLTDDGGNKVELNKNKGKIHLFLLMD